MIHNSIYRLSRKQMRTADGSHREQDVATQLRRQSQLDLRNQARPDRELPGNSVRRDASGAGAGTEALRRGGRCRREGVGGGRGAGGAARQNGRSVAGGRRSAASRSYKGSLRKRAYYGLRSKGRSRANLREIDEYRRQFNRAQPAEGILIPIKRLGEKGAAADLIVGGWRGGEGQSEGD